MAENEGFNNGDHVSTTSFSQLLFSEEDDVLGLETGNHHQSSFGYSFAGEKTPKMLCFGSCQQSECEKMLFGERENIARSTPPPPPPPNQKSGVTCSDSNSSASSGNNSSVINTLPKFDRKRNGSDQESVQCTTITTTTKTPMATKRTGKRTKAENPTSTTGHAKVRKEKLGERVTALQQLVSPFGKTDTASVLHEAMGYIRFLHDQVQVLCSPYLQHLPDGEENGGGDQSRTDLRSRGLCLVPVACTAHVANSNGADFWSPVTGHSTVTSTNQQ